MKIKTYVLGYYALLFIGFGLASVISPDLMASLIYFGISEPIAKMEFMATYGGLFIGLGAFMAYCGKAHTDLGLVCVLFSMGTMLLFRGVGYVSLGRIDTIQTIYLSGELFTVILIIYLLLRERKRPKATPADAY